MRGVVAGDEAAKGGVYTLRDAAGKVVRTGRSRDLARRELEHARDCGDYVFRVEYRTDVLAQQRGLEEILYRRYPEAMVVKGGFNKIGAISGRNANRTLYLEAAEQYLGGRW